MNSVTHQRETTASAPSRRAPGAWFDAGDPSPSRGPFDRWPRAADSLLAAVVFVISLIAVAVSAVDDGAEFSLASIGDEPVLGFALLGVAALALLWRRRHPIAVTAVVLVIMTAWAVAGLGDGHDLALIVATYSVGRYTIDQRHSVATVAAVIAVTIIDTIIDSQQRVDIAPALLLAGLPWYLGRRIRNRREYLALLRERADRLQADQHAEARRAVADERSRIARELHDVVAHRVSMMTVQAGAAKTVARDDLDAAVDAMGDVERAGRQALGELRHLLGVLRPETADVDVLGPQPGLGDIASLTDALTQTGADLTLTIAELTADIPVAVDLSAYRIVQESLTNIVKHAGANPAVCITIGIADRGLDIEITNTVISASADLPGSGYGIVGMRERAQLLGGQFVAEPLPRGSFRVAARLPLDPAPT